MKKRLFRTELGPKFSEGSRLFWLALIDREETQADATGTLDFSGGRVSRLLYGDAEPSIDEMRTIARIYGVPTGTWFVKPSRKFETPAAVAGAR